MQYCMDFVTAGAIAAAGSSPPSGAAAASPADALSSAVLACPTPGGCEGGERKGCKTHSAKDRFGVFFALREGVQSGLGRRVVPKVL